MKRIDLIRRLEDEGCLLIRHGGRHDWYQNPKTGASQPIPRHREIKELLAKHILKKLSPYTP
jgi:predicted RNA binding protein YcfA (HicA-like mRNA interferase family)